MSVKILGHPGHGYCKGATTGLLNLRAYMKQLALFFFFFTKLPFEHNKALEWQLICLPCTLYFPLQPKRQGGKQRHSNMRQNINNSCQTVEK